MSTWFTGTGSSLGPPDFLLQLLPSVDWIKMISFRMIMTANELLLHPHMASISLPPCLMLFCFFSFFPLLSSLFLSISLSVCSARPAVVLATGTVWSCARAGRAGKRCQSPSVLNTVGLPPGCAATFSAALPLSGWQALGERWGELSHLCRGVIFKEVHKVLMRPLSPCVPVFCQMWTGSRDALGAVSDPHGPAVQWVPGSSAAGVHAAVQEQMWPQSSCQYREPRRSEVKVHSLQLFCQRRWMLELIVWFYFKYWFFFFILNCTFCTPYIAHCFLHSAKYIYICTYYRTLLICAVSPYSISSRYYFLFCLFS